MHIQLNVTSAMGMYNTAFSTGVFVRTSVTGALTWLVQKQTSVYKLRNSYYVTPDLQKYNGFK
jgi:hypothetical protein